jgi:hypothetical protein
MLDGAAARSNWTASPLALPAREFVLRCLASAPGRVFTKAGASRAAGAPSRPRRAAARSNATRRGCAAGSALTALDARDGLGRRLPARPAGLNLAAVARCRRIHPGGEAAS